MNKIFVLDTNILIHDPDAIYNFGANEVVIPITVLEELDNLKVRHDSVGHSARASIRLLDELVRNGRVLEGIKLQNDGIMKIVTDTSAYELVADFLDTRKPDNRVLAVAIGMKKKFPDRQVILVSKDMNVRVKANAFDVHAEDYETDKVNVTELFKGFEIVFVSRKTIEKFYRENRLKLEDHKFYPNQCVLLKVENGSASALCKYYKAYDELIPLYHIAAKPWGINARNLEQRFALELLLSDEIQIVSLMGIAGTGKTLLALAAGLQKVVEEKRYKRLLVSRPVIPMGKDIGYLPGSKTEKLSNWMQPITDNLDYLFATTGRDQYEYLIQQGLLEVEALTYIRGRSLPNCYFIIDEAQNLTPHEVKTIITRAGEGSKIVLTGDPYQIDNNYLDEASNGLVYCSERFRGQVIAGHITLAKGERSELATKAAELL